MGASVVTGCDASPALELCEEVLPHVALAIEHFVVDAGDFSASAWGNAGSMPLAVSAWRNAALS